MAISGFPAARAKIRSENAFLLHHVPVDIVSGGMSWLVWGAVLLLLGSGLFILQEVTQDAYHGLRSDSYRSTTGTIISNGVDWHSSDSGPDYYKLELTYDYVANDAHHTGTQLAFADSITPTFYTREAAETYLAEHYPVGGEVIVYYDPELSDQAVLRPGYSLQKSLPNFILPLLLMVTGGFVVLRTRKRHVRRLAPVGSPPFLSMGKLNDYISQKLIWVPVDMPRQKGVAYHLCSPDYDSLLGVIEWQHHLFRSGAVAQVGKEWYLVYENSRLLTYETRVRLVGEETDLAIRKGRQVRFHDGRIFHLRNRLGGRPDCITDQTGKPVMMISDGFEPKISLSPGAPLDAAPALALIAIYQIKKAEDSAD